MKGLKFFPVHAVGARVLLETFPWKLLTFLQWQTCSILALLDVVRSTSESILELSKTANAFVIGLPLVPEETGIDHVLGKGKRPDCANTFAVIHKEYFDVLPECV